MALSSLRNLTELQRLTIICPPLQELPVGNWVKLHYLRLSVTICSKSGSSLSNATVDADGADIPAYRGVPRGKLFTCSLRAADRAPDAQYAGAGSRNFQPQSEP